MKLGIKGNSNRGAEVIKILEMLGGVNRHNLTGIYDDKFYYISEYKGIVNSFIDTDEIKGYEIFSLEDFLEKFPCKVGDKVNVWKYYLEGRSELEEGEIKSMRWNSARCEVAYRMKELTGEFYKNDIRGKVNGGDEQKPNSTIEYTEIDKQCFDEVHKRYSDITHVFLTGHGYTLPDGFHLVDENGKTIDASKIRLVKNAPTYPKTYEECCKVLSIPSYYKLKYSTYEHNYHEYTTSKKLCLLQDNLNRLGKLLICRDAYWKIAGEELGLDKPWEPVWDESEDLYTIHTFNGEIRLSGTAHRNAILVFPTEEMRDTFDVTFEKLIEKCKELL